MRLPSLLPPADLLQEVQGVEAALRRRRRLGLLGWAGVLLGLGSQLAAVVAASEWFTALRQLRWEAIREDWPLLVLLLVGALSFVVVTWSRFWLQESRQPFRYTFSAGDFVPLPTSRQEDKLEWLRHDLNERLSQRIGRLSLLEEGADARPAVETPDTGTETGQQRTDTSHIHISGQYVIRRQANAALVELARTPAEQAGDAGDWVIEVRPWIRIGPPGRPHALAHPVKYTLKDAVPGREATAGEANAGPVALTQQQYERLLERVYFSVATEIYGQLRDDVQRKIDLLPSDRFRATAYFFEAQDYARSNTLDAYDEARELYEQARRLYGDPALRTLSLWLPLRTLQRGLRWAARVGAPVRAATARLWPRVGQIDVKRARAEIGYADMILYRRLLAGLSGRLVNAVFEARPVVERAVARLTPLPPTVDGRDEALFDAHVTLALAWAQLGSLGRAAAELDVVRDLDPARAERDAHYLFVRGEAQTRRLSAIPLYRRAVELDPAFEVAQFRLAISMEEYWRTLPTFEPDVAALVFKEYEYVLAMNPGNIGAWANVGYMAWLQDDALRAEYAFESGREYKDIKRETFVVELDYGLARLAAERGDFSRAYRHYYQALTAYIAQGVGHGAHSAYGYTGYFYELIDDQFRRRFEQYRQRVEEKLDEEPRPGKRPPGKRVRDAVHAFVLTEYGQATLNYFRRAGDPRCLVAARAAFRQATRLDRTNVLPWYELYHMQAAEESGLKPGGRLPAAYYTEYIERVNRLEPDWPVGKLALATDLEARARAARQEARRKGREAEEKGRAAEERARQAAEAGENAEHMALHGATAPGTALGTPSPFARHPKADRLEERAERLAAQAEELRHEAAKLRKEAQEAAEDAKARLERARQILRDLLPHSWVWRGPGREGDERPDRGRSAVSSAPHEAPRASAPWDFDWRALERQDYRDALRWEKEFNDFQVEVLCRGADLLGDSEPVATRGRAAGRRRAAHLQALLRRHVWDRFRPEDFELARRIEQDSADPDEQRRCRDTQRRNIEQWVDRDPKAYWVLTWCTPERLGPRAQDILVDVAKDPNLPGFLHLWVGDRLRELAEREDDPEQRRKEARRASLKAYRWARRKDVPALLHGVGLGLEQLRRWDECLEVYQRALEVDRERAAERQVAREYPDDRHRYDVARALWALGRTAEALARLDAVTAAASGLDAHWRSGFVRFAVDGGHVSLTDSYHRLRQWMEHEQRRSAGVDVRVDAGRAVLLLVQRVRGPAFARPTTDDGEPALPTVVPIVLEAGRGLFPQRAGTVQAMLSKHMPRVRVEIRRQTGVRIPDVRIRANDALAAREFVVRLHEIPVFSETVPAAEGDDHAGRAFRKIQELVLRDLDTYLGTQDVEARLREWSAAAPDRRSLLAGAVPDLAAKVCLVAVLQRLVRERVPVGDLSAILDAFARAYPGSAAGSPVVEVHDVVESLRAALRDDLPGRDAARAWCRLPPVAEELLSSWIEQGDGRRFLAIPRSSGPQLEALEQAVARTARGRGPDNVTLVVHEPGLRRFVRRVTEQVAPALPVLASSELHNEVQATEIPVHDLISGPGAQ